MTAPAGLAPILLAEDDENIAKLILLKLGREGYRVERARDGEDASARLEERRWSLLVLDITMPLKSGWDVLRDLRSNPSFAKLPVLVLSARSELPPLGPEFLERVEIFAKPFDPEELVKRVRRLVMKS